MNFSIKNILTKIKNKEIVTDLTNKTVNGIYKVADKCFDMEDVTPNTHVAKDIWLHPMSSCYEHMDENGNWVEGPAHGHGGSDSFETYNEKHPSFIDRLYSSVENKLEHTGAALDTICDSIKGTMIHNK